MLNISTNNAVKPYVVNHLLDLQILSCSNISSLAPTHS